MSKFKIGDKAIITKNSNHHRFSKGQTVDLVRLWKNIENNKNVFWCSINGGVSNLVRVSDLELVKQKDSIVQSVRKDLKQRSKVGIDKYACTLDRKDLSLLEWHQHHYEELLDAALYTKRIITELETKNK